jgi:hypothetical protein
MLSGDDPAAPQARELERADVMRCTVVDRQLKGEVEVAVIERSVLAYLLESIFLFIRRRASGGREANGRISSFSALGW